MESSSLINPGFEEVVDYAHEYRLFKIKEIQEYFEKERDKRIALGNAYRIVVRVVGAINTALLLVVARFSAIALVAAPLIRIVDQFNKNFRLKKRNTNRLKPSRKQK